MAVVTVFSTTATEAAVVRLPSMPATSFCRAATSVASELVIVQGADHADPYDQMDKIPFEKLAAFFRDNLK